MATYTPYPLLHLALPKPFLLHHRRNGISVLVTRGLLPVDTYQRHHWESAMVSADVNGVAGNS